jgi:hypothetical protein
MFRERAREPRRLGIVVLLSLVAVCASAAAISSAQTIYVEVGGVKTSFSATIKPKALSASKRAPISARVLARVQGQGPGHIPAIARATIGIDRGLTIDARGVPACSAAQLEGQTTAGVQAACAGAIVGRGSATVAFDFPSNVPTRAGSRLLAVNGGVAGGTTTLFIHAYLSTPVPQAIVVPIVFTKLTKGGYGLHAEATVPKIAGGAGSLAVLDLTMRRMVATASGGSHGYLLARCSDGNLVFEPEVEFESGARARGLLAQGCDARR